MTNEKSIQEPCEGKVPIPDGELYFETKGKGKPLIFIHAGFSDRRDWKYQLEDFGKRFYTIVYDQRGSGHSSIITIAFSPAEDLKALMDCLKIQKTIVIGHSLGGSIALDFALQYPEKISALVLLAPGLNGYTWSKEYVKWVNTIWNVSDPVKMTEQALSAPFYKIAMSDPNIKLDIEQITQQSFEKILTWKTFDINDVRWLFPEPIFKLKDLKMPTLVVYGDKDSQDIQQIAQILNINIPNIRIEKIENSDHLLNFEKSQELNALVLDFLSGCDS